MGMVDRKTEQQYEDAKSTDTFQKGKVAILHIKLIWWLVREDVGRWQV
jgi:hypothetical protein